MITLSALLIIIAAILAVVSNYSARGQLVLSSAVVVLCIALLLGSSVLPIR